MSPINDNPSAPRFPRKLPDPAICRARRADGPGLVSCLVPAPVECKHAGFFDDDAYCLHPDREAIIIRTKPE